MNDLQPANTSNSPLFAHFKFDDFEVSWAGLNPFRTGFCFGSEDGRLLFTDEEGNTLFMAKGSKSGEAVNGMARLDKWLVVSTRAEINIWQLPDNQGGNRALVVFPHGAHGVLATPDGSLFAPLGRTGFLATQPPFGATSSATVVSGGPESWYCYRLASVRSGDGQDLLACANRLGGVGVTTYQKDLKSLSISDISFSGLDVVDVCALNPGSESLAVAAVGRDGTLILVRDMWNQTKPITMKFGNIEGTAYRLMSCRGHLFLLTSKGMYVLADIATRFAAGEAIDYSSTSVLELPLEAVDARMCGDRWLLIVLPDEVLRVDIDLIHQSIPAEFRKVQPRSISLDWKRHDFEQVTSQVMADVA